LRGLVGYMCRVYRLESGVPDLDEVLRAVERIARDTVEAHGDRLRLSSNRDEMTPHFTLPVVLERVP
jgi:hypothetical protein